MKINNKGMTLVELLVTFSLLLIIVVGLYNLILEVKFEIDDKQIVKDTTEYSSLINNDIHYNLLIDKPFAVAIKEKNTSSSSWTCFNNTGTCGSTGVNFVVSYTKGSVSAESTTPFNTHNNLCKGIFPCVIYYYLNDNNKIGSKIIALNKDNPDNDNESLKVKGILYGNASEPIFEPVPNNEFIEIRDIDLRVDGDDVSTVKDKRPYIEVDTENGVLIINYALYIIEDDQNYGFKIAYPNGFKKADSIS